MESIVVYFKTISKKRVRRAWSAYGKDNFIDDSKAIFFVIDPVNVISRRKGVGIDRAITTRPCH